MLEAERQAFIKMQIIDNDLAGLEEEKYSSQRSFHNTRLSVEQLMDRSIQDLVQPQPTYEHEINEGDLHKLAAAFRCSCR